MRDRQLTSRLDTIRTVGAVARESVRDVVKEAVVEALEEHEYESQSGEEESSMGGRSRGKPGAFLLVMIGAVGGYLLWRRKSGNDRIVDTVGTPSAESEGVTTGGNGDVTESETGAGTDD